MKRYKLSSRKEKFAEYYLTAPRHSETCGNAYRSALKAGFSDSYAKRITADMNWQELKHLAEKQGYVLEEGTYIFKKLEKAVL